MPEGASGIGPVKSFTAPVYGFGLEQMAGQVPVAGMIESVASWRCQRTVSPRLMLRLAGEKVPFALTVTSYVYAAT